ncbi:sulfotransferase 1 family member D1 [Caerostris darwini]|uniref:Sulfotransferase 1 family member D1 n=1 Tax=Caerostris darwini TaxID=1538125 RepID=A0AAV4U1F0_9ARAC|nr:sulfotransferase 1 family member D1 [Caerostris darwini]
MGKKPRYEKIEGMLTPSTFVPEVYRDAMAFKPRLDDVFVPTYPKCRTTWVQQIVSLIFRKGKTLLTSEEYFATLPFLEMTPMDILSMLEKPRCIKTHLPFDRISFSKDAKYICVARHPADCVVSFFHHTRFFPTYFFSDGCFDDFFELFIKGEVDWNDYFDHLLSWYENKDEPNILFLTYEAMKSDPPNACLKIARFLGETYYNLLTENDETMLKKVLEYSSVEFMKATVNEFWREQFSAVPSEELQMLNPVVKKFAKLMEEAEKEGHVPLGGFIRKGVVGDGEITLSKEQLDKLNERINQKTSHSDVMNLWKMS